MQLATVQKPEFVVFSREFGYPMWAADVPNRPDVEITDQIHEMATFGNPIAAKCTAQALTHLYGYPWQVLACAS